MPQVLLVAEPDEHDIAADLAAAGRCDPYRGDDSLWRDVMRAEHADGHAAQLRQLVGELMQARDAEIPEDLS